MKLSCLQENLNEGLSIVSRAVATRTTLPITQHVLVNTDQNRLKLSATNLEIAISTWIGAEIEEEGTMTLPARLFTELVGTLPQDTIDLECDQESQESSFTCGRIKSKIKGGDYKVEEVVGNDICEVKIYKYLSGYSTTKILERK